MISKLEKSGGKFNYFQYALFRYLRLIPSLIGSIFFLWLFPLILSGPIAKEVYSLFLEGCERWYETVFLYHNYKASYPTPALCNPPSWSLAGQFESLAKNCIITQVVSLKADFHLYLIAPIIFLKMHSRPKMGIAYGIIGVIIGSLCCLAPKLLGIASYYEWRSIESAIDLTLSTRHHFYGKFSMFWINDKDYKIVIIKN
jgi:peptidoglycan/LPS O-acetylase OafA/YrhL